MDGSPWYMGIDLGADTESRNPSDYFAEAIANADDDFDGFVVGDIVSLIVGGPDMVVVSTCECGSVEVAWAKMDGDVMVDAFPEEALTYVE